MTLLKIVGKSGAWFADVSDALVFAGVLLIFIVCAFYLGHFATVIYYKKRKSRFRMDGLSPKNTYVMPKSFVVNNNYLNNNDNVNRAGLQTGFSTVIGSRKYQQDSIIATDDEFMRTYDYKKCIAILCDGMGGMEGGEIASAISAKTLFQDYLQRLPNNVPVFFVNEVKKLDNIVSNLTNKDNEQIKSGSTLVSVIIDNGNLFWVSVGDSRIYMIRNNEIAQISEDHNYYSVLKHQVQNGLISYEEAANNPKKEALTSFIGIGRESEINNNDNPFKLDKNDIILLCSDGLYKTLTEDEILEIVFKSNDNMMEAAKNLTETAIKKEKKNQDNTSVILVKYCGTN